jgi:hypothetical protein
MATMTVDAKVRRGPESWAFIYIALGFALTIESTVISMIPNAFPWNIFGYAAIAAATTWLFIESDWFQGKLLGMKSRYESKLR